MAENKWQMGNCFFFTPTTSGVSSPTSNCFWGPPALYINRSPPIKINQIIPRTLQFPQDPWDEWYIYLLCFTSQKLIRNGSVNIPFVIWDPIEIATVYASEIRRKKPPEKKTGSRSYNLTIPYPRWWFLQYFSFSCQNMGERIPKFDDLPHILHQMGWGWLNHQPPSSFALKKRVGFCWGPTNHVPVGPFNPLPRAPASGPVRLKACCAWPWSSLSMIFGWGKGVGVPLAKRVVVRTNKLSGINYRWMFSKIVGEFSTQIIHFFGGKFPLFSPSILGYQKLLETPHMGDWGRRFFFLIPILTWIFNT